MSDRPLASYSLFNPRRGIGRLVVALLAAALAAAVTPTRCGWHARLTVAWDGFALALCLLAWTIILTANAAQTRRRAGDNDPGRTVVWVIVVFGCLLSLGSSTLLLPKAQAQPAMQVAAGLAVVASWFVMHTAFALRYAHLYYRESDGVGGLSFPGDEPPDDLDFAYFAFTIGACFQVSDVAVSSRAIRRTVLVHALLSYGFSTVILALALNLGFALLAA